MIRILLSLAAPEQEIVYQEAQHALLKDLNRLKAVYQAQGQYDQGAEEEDTHINVNGEENGENYNEEIPSPHI